MSIIGVVASEKQTNEIKKQIEKEGLKIEVVCINAKSIENIKNIKFDILIIQEPLEKLKEKQEYVRIMLKSTKYLLLNSDITINEDIFNEVNMKILTYGLKQKATITASSIGERQIIISIQRAFKNINANIIEQQEIPVELAKNDIRNLYNSLIKTAIINIFSTRNR